jgi:hypothetical protein
LRGSMGGDGGVMKDGNNRRKERARVGKCAQKGRCCARKVKERKGKEVRCPGKELVTGHEYLHAGDRRDTGVFEDIVRDNTKN